MLEVSPRWVIFAVRIMNQFVWTFLSLDMPQRSEMVPKKTGQKEDKQKKGSADFANFHVSSMLSLNQHRGTEISSQCLSKRMYVYVRKCTCLPLHLQRPSAASQGLLHGAAALVPSQRPKIALLAQPQAGWQSMCKVPRPTFLHRMDCILFILYYTVLKNVVSTWQSGREAPCFIAVHHLSITSPSIWVRY